LGATRDGITQSLAPRYEVGHEIGQGGMATVYRAVDRRSGAIVAIKVMRAEVASPMASARFTKEIQLTARLQHPHILPVLDAGESNGVPWYVMPFVAGDTLLDRLKREHQLPIDEAVRLAGEVADALGHAHGLGIIHRDIKPSNILLSDGHAVVSDFGIARVVDEATPERITSSGLAVGTVHYMSPEQATTERLDGRSDQYSLACLLYEMLGGAPPFAGASAQGIMARHAIDPVPSLHTLRNTVPQSLERVIARALSKAPSDRYPSMKAFREAMEQALAQPDQAARPPVTRRALVTAGLVTVAAAMGYLALQGGTSGPSLDPNRVMVFPLVVTYAAEDSAVLGENLATMIGSVLDGAGSLRWIDAWPLMDRAASLETGSPVAAGGALARQHGSRYFVLGRVSRLSGATQVNLVVYDAEHDEAEAGRGDESGAEADVVRLSRQAVNRLLPSILPGAPATATSGWEERDPRAIAEFLIAERAFRRSQSDSALAHYQAAVQQDSAFSLAAIRGAQAASWAHRESDAAVLIARASRQPLVPRYAAFVRGYEHFLAGRADSAIAALRSAVSLDSEMGAAWLQLGEAYRHLLPAGGETEPLADSAFARASALDPGATNATWHRIESMLRRGDVRAATPLAAAFLAAAPDTVMAREIEVGLACMRDGPDRVDWADWASRRPLPLLLTGLWLGATGAQLDCAQPAFRAILAVDTGLTPDADGRRWTAAKALQSALVLSGRSDEALATVDSFVARWQYGSTLYLLAAPVDSAHLARARDVLDATTTSGGASLAGVTSPTRLWELGLVADRLGRPEIVRHASRLLFAMSDSLRRAGADTLESRRDSLMAASLAVRAALADGDTTVAMADLQQLVPSHVAHVETQYDEAWPLAGERVLLARLLLARGDPARAARVASVVDSPAAMMHVLFLPASLRVRFDAAQALGQTGVVASLRNRLSRLGATRGNSP